MTTSSLPRYPSDPWPADHDERYMTGAFGRVCRACGASVDSGAMALHDRWHAAQTADR